MFLSRKKDKWANARATSLKGYLVGVGVSYNSRADAYYRKAMDKETGKFLKALLEELQSEYGEVKVENAQKSLKRQMKDVAATISKARGAKLRVYIKNSEKIIRKWLRLARLSADSDIKKSLGELAGKQLAINYDSSYGEALKLMIHRNVGLITNAGTQTLTNIENIVYDGMTTGLGWKEISDGLKHQTEISAKRIKLIARDQTAKANAALNELSQKAAGIKFFMWRTAQDERVSTGYGGHKQLNGKIYKWGETERYPIIDSYGHRGLPAQRPNCRCRAKPLWVLDGYVAEWDNARQTYKIIRDWVTDVETGLVIYEMLKGRKKKKRAEK